MAVKRKTFTVQFDVKTMVCVELKAETMEDALKQAREYGVRDVVDIHGDYQDGEIEVITVMAP